jgi:hypothetical protein
MQGGISAGKSAAENKNARVFQVRWMHLLSGRLRPGGGLERLRARRYMDQRRLPRQRRRSESH